MSYNINKIKASLPRLRFQEFKVNWNLITIGDCTLSSAFGPRFSSELYSELGTVVTLRTTDMDNDGNINFDHAPLATIDLESYKDHILLKDDLVISRSGTIGVTGVFKSYHKPVLPGAFLIRFRFNTERLLPNFVRFVFNSQRGRTQIESLSAGGVQKNLTGSSILKMNLYVPELLEQQKIASFLSAVDEKIQQLTRKKELLEQYKKGVMQQLFSGKLRFKDENGKDYPEWVKTDLGEISEINMGQSPDSKSYNANKNGVALIQGNADIQNRKSDPRQWTTEPTKMCSYGDLLLTVRAPVGFVAKSAHNACIGRGVCSIKNNKASDIEFLYQYLLYYEPRWKSVEQGSTFTAVNGADIKKVKLLTPVKEEQIRIGQFLSEIDFKTIMVTTQITQTQTFKKGLLQQMFV